MHKQQADQIITSFMEKIFGFALTKTLNTDKAQELAARITFDVYTSLLKTDHVHNMDGYIYRISSNVYARFVDEAVRGRHISLDNVHVSAAGDFTLDVEKNETYHRLRQQVSYLGKLQREIVVMHYFDGLKQSEIARRLQLPQGTVKWHLHEARNQLKGGFQMNEKQHANLHLSPIRLTHMGSSGNPMPGKGTDFYLSKLIAQNIAYAAYWQPKTISEIAEAIGVPAAFIEDEVAYLEAHSFLDKLAGGKYQTNMYIIHLTKELMERKHELYKQYAKQVCEHYVPLVLERMDAEKRPKGLYIPKEDTNFLMWSAVSYACKHKFFFKPAPHDSKYKVKRVDGGDYIAIAVIFDEKDMQSLSFNFHEYLAPNNMTRYGDYPVQSWQLTTWYDNRGNDYEDNRYEDYCWLYDYMNGKMTKEAAHVDQYKRLMDKGYLVTDADGEYINMVISTMTCEAFEAALPTPPDIFKQMGDELDQAIYGLEKESFPAHMQELCKLWNANCFSDQNFVAYVLAQLVVDGVLTPLTDAQKASVNTIMFCDMLP